MFDFDLDGIEKDYRMPRPRGYLDSLHKTNAALLEERSRRQNQIFYIRINAV